MLLFEYNVLIKLIELHFYFKETPMRTEIFHLAADNCEHQVVIELAFGEESNIKGETHHHATVLSFFSSKDEDRIEKAIDMACGNDNDVQHLGWDFDSQIRTFLNLQPNTPPKCCHLTNYLSKRYRISLTF